MDKKKLLILTAIMGALAVIIGAFGAHGLEGKITAERIATYNTGVHYHFYHVLAMLGTLALPGIQPKWQGRAVLAFGAGILFFSGSIYLLAIRDWVAVPTGIIGPITPIGGVLFILGWLCLALGVAKGREGA